MLRATEIKRKGEWQGPAADHVVLAYQERHRRRIAMTGQGGLAFLLDLPRAASLKEGDGLVLEDGRLVAVGAAPEPLLEITCRDPEHLTRLAWHLGNRHLPTQISGAALLILDDHVIAEMARGLGADVRPVEAAFEPEGGAYGQADHGHG